MNDPNGMVYYEGEYHLFYQYYPGGLQWGPMHWGHAVSTDLLHWKHLPVALEPDELGMIFSGSAVVDWNDSTGFFNGRHGLVAIYTSAGDTHQQQSIAYSLDKGRTWIKYQGNPVVPNDEIKDFRDPKVFWHEDTKQWLMVLAAGQEILFYTSPDLKEWVFASRFGEGHGAHGGVWECPDLFELPVENGAEGDTRWVLQVDIGDGAASGGSGGQYFIGSFDGQTFVNEGAPEEIRWVDYGKDFYATQSFSDIPESDGRRIWMAWMSNWQYANEVPTSPWRSAMTLPREVAIRKESDGQMKLVQYPVRELKQLAGESFAAGSYVLSSESATELCEVPEGPAVYDVLLDLSSCAAAGFCLYGTGADKGFVLKADRESGTLTADRSDMQGSDFHEKFPAVTSAPLPISDGVVELSVVLDTGSVEIFSTDGTVTMTNLVLPEKNNRYSISGFAEAGKAGATLTGRRLRSVWDR
ncbi:hypothetical protein CR205_10420 [Alteribacter lacisalsi]|uniref:Glycoside hydrolase family 32 protein n=2 Tax=Alteribacter lacisalsi TaxID=2045244 RepID=A0A2W0HED4_9BACI|nr:hypothetical protein CR205_10420 [Alteribacter lacisalsi]